jgi:hypothetical protein
MLVDLAQGRFQLLETDARRRVDGRREGRLEEKEAPMPEDQQPQDPMDQSDEASGGVQDSSAQGNLRGLCRSWKVVRGLLGLLEASLVLTKHEALAAGARALVMAGDAILGPGKNR